MVLPAVTRRAWCPLLLAPIFALVTPGPFAAERLQRRFGLQEGLPFSEVDYLSQDSRGFLWIGTTGGLFRYDGIEMRPWPRAAPRPLVRWIASGPNGEVVMVGDSSILLRVEGEALEPVAGPEGRPLAVDSPPVWDGDGCLWALSGGRLLFRRASGDWSEFRLPTPGSARLTGISAGGDGSVLLLTRNEIVRLDSMHDATRLGTVDGAARALMGPDGAAVALTVDGRVVEVRTGSARALYGRSARPIDIVRHGTTIWASYDVGLVALRPGEPPEELGPEEEVPSGGPLLVDREQSLWLGTFRGLRQFPAFGTVAWPPASARRLAISDEGIWIDTWGGLLLARRGAGGERIDRQAGTATSALCRSDQGVVWAGSPGRFLERAGGRFVDHPRPGLGQVRDCAAGAGGRVWMTTDVGLSLAGRSEGRSNVRDVPEPPSGTAAPLDSVLEGPDGILRVTRGETICRTAADAAAAGGRPVWRCDRMEGAGRIHDLELDEGGSVWAATARAGARRLDDRGGNLAPLPGFPELPTRVIRRLRPSPSGGIWIISFGTILRVARRPGESEAWDIVERPSTWHGLMISDAEDILEEASGDLWIATLAGVARIPAEIRRSGPPVPPVELVDVLVDGESMSRVEGIVLPYRRNRIEMRFAGLSFRDPGLLRYQVRLHSDAPWIDASGRPSFRFVDLSAGTYHAEVRASLDGSRWSDRAAELSFTVLPPFWRTWWFTLLAAAATAAAIYALYRYRLAQAVRLERIRTHIATDLHDDIGASLSQIAILNEVALTRLRTGGDGAAGLLATAAESARELVDAMSDVVWAVDPKRDRLEDLVLRMRRFAEGLCAARGVDLKLAAPEDGARRLDARTRRQVFLIFKESLNNAMKHSGCSSVAVELSIAGSGLQLAVADDGRGFDPRESHESHGLVSMTRRSEALGGRTEIRSAPGEGTSIRVSIPI